MTYKQRLYKHRLKSRFISKEGKVIKEELKIQSLIGTGGTQPIKETDWVPRVSVSLSVPYIAQCAQCVTINTG